MKTYPDVVAAKAALVRQGEAEWLLPIGGRKPVRLIANDAIMAGFDDTLFTQIVNVAEMPGAKQVVITPDSHVGFGCPVGCTVVTDSHVYPPVVGPDALCSMSLLQTDLPESEIVDLKARRALISEICQRIPTGVGNRTVPKQRPISRDLMRLAAIHGADEYVLKQLGVPVEWAHRLECRSYGRSEELALRFRALEDTNAIPNLGAKLDQAGSTGAGNHFISLDVMDLRDAPAAFGLKHGALTSLTHCGSRGFGYRLMEYHGKRLKAHFERWGIPFPGGDDHLTFAPLGTPEAKDYLDDLHLAANFAIVNHLLINLHVLDAVQAFCPGTAGQFIYHVSHNVGQEEIVDGRKAWVYRKGATRAFPAGHPGLKDSPFEAVGHPILLPGNARDGSYVMVARPEAVKAACTINHGAGRSKGRKQAKRELNQASVDQDLFDHNVLHNGRLYPLDEAPAAYKDFDVVTQCVEQAGLASVVAKLVPRFVIKDNDQSAEGSA